MSKLTVDNSTVYISRADGKDFEPTRLTITENYVGNNGVLHLRTELGGDNSVTDKVVINGNTYGSAPFVPTKNPTFFYQAPVK